MSRLCKWRPPIACLANNGTWVKPHVVRELRMPDGTVTYQAKTESRTVLRSETVAALRSMLEGVTLHGTAKRAQLEGYTAAGKTGTAQKIDPTNARLFVDEIHRVVCRLRAGQ